MTDHPARDYIGRLFFGLTTTAVDAPERSFQSFAANHATADGINEQFLKHLVERGLLTSVSEALDAVLHRISAQSQTLPKTPSFGPQLDPDYWGEPLRWHKLFGHSWVTKKSKTTEHARYLEPRFWKFRSAENPGATLLMDTSAFTGTDRGLLRSVLVRDFLFQMRGAWGTHFSGRTHFHGTGVPQSQNPPLQKSSAVPA
jgi:hypothetical protein